MSSLSQLPQIQTLGQDVGRSPNIVNFYEGFNSTFPLTDAQEVSAIGAEPEITWEPWLNQLGANQNTYPLPAIAAGQFDTYITAFAKERRSGASRFCCDSDRR